MDPATVELQFYQVEQALPASTSQAARQRHSKKKGKKGGKPGNQGHFHGSRAAFIDEFLPTFIKLKGTKRAIQRKFWDAFWAAYWTRFPWYYALDEDPETTSREAPEETDEVLAQKSTVIQETQARIRAHLRYRRQVQLRGIINAWDTYFPDPRETLNPPPAPRRLSSWQLYMSKKAEEVQAEFETRWPSTGLHNDFRLSFRGQIARELLEKEDLEYREALNAEVEELHAADMALEKENAKAADAAIPLEEQIKARDNLVGLAQPMLETMRKRTGMYFALVAGVPLLEGSREFQLKIVTAGKTAGPVPLPWHLAEQERFKVDIMGSFTRFLTLTEEYKQRTENMSAGSAAATSGPSMPSGAPMTLNDADSTPAPSEEPLAAAPQASKSVANSKSKAKSSNKKSAQNAKSTKAAKGPSKGKAKAKPKKKGSGSSKDSDAFTPSSESDSDSDSDSDSSSEGEGEDGSEDRTPNAEDPNAEDEYEDPPEGVQLPTIESLGVSAAIIAYFNTLSPEDQRRRLYSWATFTPFMKAHMLPSICAKEAEARAKRAAAERPPAAPSTHTPASTPAASSPAAPTASTAESRTVQPSDPTPPITPPAISSPPLPPQAPLTGLSTPGLTSRPSTDLSAAAGLRTDGLDASQSPDTTHAQSATAIAAGGSPDDRAPSTCARNPSSGPPRDTSMSPGALEDLAASDVVIVNEEGWPKWIREMFDFVEARGLGPTFMRIVEWWTVLERSYDFKSGKGFAVEHRPPQIGHWMRVQRPPTGGEGDWQNLMVPGQNGLMMVILSLVWWKEVAETTQAAWEAAVKDVSWVVNSMVKAAARSSDNSDASRNTRKRSTRGSQDSEKEGERASKRTRTRK
ncbi:hypothetical protein K466DRAFT_605927 [Polyporus arcularius HHB13444]|uniref:Uncharacterized protein n=1 Tax=Polyporus arcularius HHB13444 TaxID=1314778 RepID=A0A5C3NQ82_9APHY|nr:hypothetical protein K466DRAFT_605927 [Polyporus arcularius HHB13444]